MKTTLSNIGREQKALIVIIVIYIVTRLYAYVYLHFAFSFKISRYLVQYADINLLKENIIESLFYLHSQPPLFNFLLGISKIIFGNNASLSMFILFQLCGLLTAVLLYKMMIELSIRKWLCFGFTILYIITPATLLYENLFFYTHIVIFFFITAAFLLCKFLQSKKTIYIKLHFIFLLLISLTTSFFHLIWFLFIAVFVFWILKFNRKEIALALIIPVIILLGLYTKNLILFGDFNSSSWFGMNLSRITVFQMPTSEKEELFKNGLLSEVSLLPPFPQYDVLWKLKTIKKDSIGVEIADQTTKPGGRTNFNNLIYLKISKAAFNDSKFIIEKYPQYYLQGIKKAFQIYFEPPSNYGLINKNLLQINFYNNIYNALIYGASKSKPLGYFTVMLTTFVMIGTSLLLLKKNISNKDKIILALMLFNIIYVMIVGNLFEVGENNRFRFYTEIFSYVLFAYLLNLVLKILIRKNNIQPEAI